MTVTDSTPEGNVTAELCNWVTELKSSDIPTHVLQRAKHLLLDGIACGLVGSHVPWSEQAAQAIDDYEPEGYCSVIGYNRVYSIQYPNNELAANRT